MIILFLGELSSHSNSNAALHHRYLVVSSYEKCYWIVYFL